MKNPMPVCSEAKRKIIKPTSKEIQMKTVRVRIENDRRIVSEKEKYPEEKLPNAKQIISNTMKIENVENGGGENSDVQSITEDTFENCPSEVKGTLDVAGVEITDETKKEKLENASDDDVNNLDFVEIDVDDSLCVDSKVSYLFGHNSIVILFWL